MQCNNGYIVPGPISYAWLARDICNRKKNATEADIERSTGSRRLVGRETVHYDSPSYLGYALR